MKIAIVDDNRTNLVLMRGFMQQLPGNESIEFTDSVEALSWCTTNHPDLVIVDYMMPKMDGLEFIRAFRAHEDSAGVPMLMVTASHETEVRIKALDLGANDFLTKPVDRMELLVRVRNMLALRQGQKALVDRAAWLAGEVAKATQEIVQRERDTIVRLARAAEHRDPETGGHILRMAHYSQLIARNMGLSEEQQALLLTAAPMHDVGKVATPDSILLKPGRLTDDEMAIMRQHAYIGYEILSGSDSPLLQMAATIAYSHHEKFDGSGYPRRLKGEDIPLVGRIVAVADVFDALTSERPYKKAWEFAQAASFLRDNVWSHFDPVCVAAFLRDEKAVWAIRDRFQDSPEEREAMGESSAKPTSPSR
ncbi:MAG TPA: response regulator [Burkholderiaceae bacterium]|nr:response regulator [Burkholderiaceae bacterium]